MKQSVAMKKSQGIKLTGVLQPLLSKFKFGKFNLKGFLKSL